MIILYPPSFKSLGEKVMLFSKYSLDGEPYTLWYKFPKKYRDYLVVERLDAFLVGLLFLGLKTGKDIYVKGHVSHRLYYSINHYLIEILCAANPSYKKIKIIVEELNKRDLNMVNSAGTGLSCGVDSFATYYDHIEEDGNFEIKYFTFFDVGSHGVFKGKRAGEIFNERLNNSSEFAKKVGKELITVESNLSEVLDLPFQATNTLRNISCVLNLQKLFKNYYFASSYPYKYFKLDPSDTTYYDIWNLHLLSTESTTFFSSVPGLTRIEKTALISNFQTTYNFLDVCLSPNKDYDFKNCTRCEKCLRTALTLDLLDKLENYNEVFDLNAYGRQKDSYIAKVLYTRKTNIFSEELYALLKKKNILTKTHYYAKVKYGLELKWLRFKKSIKVVIKKV